MNKEKIIEKQDEINKCYKTFTQWILKWSNDPIESERGRNMYSKITRLESQLESLRSEEQQPDLRGAEALKSCENCNDLYDDNSRNCEKCDEDFSNWHPIEPTAADDLESDKPKHPLSYRDFTMTDTEPDLKGAEEILSKYWRDEYNKSGVATGKYFVTEADAIKAMQEYASLPKQTADLKGAEEILLELEHYNPYPESVFTPIKDKKLKKIIKLLIDNGYSTDCLYGNWGRTVWDNCVLKAKELFKEYDLPKVATPTDEIKDINFVIKSKIQKGRKF